MRLERKFFGIIDCLCFRILRFLLVFTKSGPLFLFIFTENWSLFLLIFTKTKRFMLKVRNIRYLCVENCWLLTRAVRASLENFGEIRLADGEDAARIEICPLYALGNAVR